MKVASKLVIFEFVPEVVVMGDDEAQTREDMDDEEPYPPTQQVDHVDRSAGKRQRVDADALESELLGNAEGLVKETLGKKIAPEIAKHLQELLVKFQKDVKSLLGNRGRKTRMLEDIEHLKAGRLPNGSKPFKPAYECKELDVVVDDLPVSDALNDIKALFAPGMSYRKLKNSAYLASMLLNRTIDSHMVDYRISKLQELVKFETFVDVAMVTPATQSERVKALDIGAPDHLFDSRDQVAMTRAKAELMYKKAVDNMAEHEHNRRARIEASSKALERANETMLTLSPNELFKASVKQAVREQNAEATKDVTKKYDVDYIAAHVQNKPAQASMKTSGSNDANVGTGNRQKAPKQPKNGRAKPPKVKPRDLKQEQRTKAPAKGKGKGKPLPKGAGKGGGKNGQHAPPTGEKGKGAKKGKGGWKNSQGK